MKALITSHVCIIFAVALLFSFACIVNATTYLYFSVDGDSSVTQVTQGQTPMIYADCSPGSTVTLEFCIDMDASGTVTDGDVSLFIFPLADNETIILPDLDPTDGALMTSFGAVGLAPMYYVCRITDVDSSSASDGIEVLANPSPPAVISGHISISGIEAPSPMLEYVWIQNSTMPLVSALTDDNGAYEINMLSDSGTEIIGPMIEFDGYATPEPIEIIYEGDTSGIDFFYNLSTAYVYGDIKDIYENPIIRDVHIYLVNQSTAERTELIATDGTYLFLDVDPDEYEIDVTTADLIPDYMTQLYWDDPYFHFTLSAGDSIRKDLTCYPTDTTITGYITMDGETPTETFYLFAFNTTMGFTKVLSEISGDFELHVALGDSSPYRVRIGTEITPIPDGYVVEGANYLYDEPVSSYLHFNLISDYGAIVGMMNSDPDYPEPDNYCMHRLSIYSAMDSTMVTHITNTYNLDYCCFLTPGDYYGILTPRPYQAIPEYLVIPSGFETTAITSLDTIELDFQYNYKHCDCFIHITGVPADSIPPACLIAEGDGSFPYCYYIEEEIDSGTTDFNFGICDAEWRFQAPNIPDYVASPAETTITIDGEHTLLHLTFEYTPSGISKTAKPIEFALYPNYPDPFNAVTRMKYSIPINGFVLFEVYDISGKLIQTLVDRDQNAGFYSVIWDGKTNSGGYCSSGVYFMKLQFEDTQKLGRLIFVK